MVKSKSIEEAQVFPIACQAFTKMERLKAKDDNYCYEVEQLAKHKLVIKVLQRDTGELVGYV